MKESIQAQNLINKITYGWNLGNYLDAHDKEFVLGDHKAKFVEDVVKLWGNPAFNLECIDYLKSVGCNCIRVPVTWCNFVNISGDVISISSEAIDAIKNIINYAIERDMVVILDMHHDDQTWLKIACDQKEFRKICKVYVRIWDIIAYEFRNYDTNLIFEGMNEVIDRSNPIKHDWVGKDYRCYTKLNKLYKLFVKTARKHSDCNKKRILMISTYGAQIHQRALELFKKPKDKNLIVDVHYYSCHTDVDNYAKEYEWVNKYLINKGVPVILGEIGTKKDCIENPDVLKAYVKYANSVGLKYVLWDNGSSRAYVDRVKCTIVRDFPY